MQCRLCPHQQHPTQHNRITYHPTQPKPPPLQYPKHTHTHTHTHTHICCIHACRKKTGEEPLERENRHRGCWQSNTIITAKRKKNTLHSELAHPRLTIPSTLQPTPTMHHYYGILNSIDSLAHLAHLFKHSVSAQLPSYLTRSPTYLSLEFF